MCAAELTTLDISLKLSRDRTIFKKSAHYRCVLFFKPLTINFLRDFKLF